MILTVKIYSPPSKSAAQGTGLNSFSAYSEVPLQNPEIVADLNINTFNNVSQNGSALKKYASSNTFVEEYGVYDQNDLTVAGWVYSANFNTSLYSSGGCSLVVIPNKNNSLTLAIQTGDIVEFSINKSVYFIGYATSIDFNSDGSSIEYIIKINQFKDRLYEINFLANLYDSGYDVKQQVKLNRQVANLIATCRVNNYLELVPIYSDINNAAFFSFYTIGDTIGGTLDKLAAMFMRSFFQRRSGAVYITQLLGSDAITKQFNALNRNEIVSSVFNDQLTIDYSMLPAKTLITYNNDLVVTNGYITAEFSPKFNDYPNRQTLFGNIESVMWDMPTTFSTSNVLAYEQVVKLNDNGLFDYKINFANTINPKNKSVARTFTQMQIYRYAFNRLKHTKIFQISTIPNETTLAIDIGDTIKIEDEYYTVTDCSVNYSKDPNVNLTLIPTIYTNPIVTISESSSTFLKLEDVVKVNSN